MSYDICGYVDDPDDRPCQTRTPGGKRCSVHATERIVDDCRPFFRELIRRLQNEESVERGLLN